MKKLAYPIFIAAISLSIISCEQNEQQTGMQTHKQQLPVLSVEQKTITTFRAQAASLEGVVYSKINSKVSGYITDVLVEDGEKVSKGQTLFKIETNTLNQDAQAAQANIEAAELEVNRLKPLVEKEIVSPVQLKTAQSKLAQARASFQSVSSSIDYANIKSPVDGYVGVVNFREGALVSPGDPTPLTTVSVTDSLFAFFSMNERDYLNFLLETEGESLKDKVNHFPPVQFKMINDSIYEQNGRIKTVSGQVNPQSGTVRFTAIFSNPKQLLSTGGSGEVLIPKTYENAVLVPEVSTYELQGKVYVYKLTDEDKAVAQIIEVIDRVDQFIIAGEGIKKGDRIIFKGLNTVSDQMPIDPQMIAMDSIAPIKKVFK